MTWTRQDGRLIAGVAAMLGLFLTYGIYTVHATRQLRRYESVVLARNRADTAAWLRIQHDADQLSLAVRNMVAATGRQTAPPSTSALGPLRQPAWALWGLQFHRLRVDLNRALSREAILAPAGAGEARRRALNLELSQFWSISDEAFHLARLGHRRQAANLVERELVPQRRELAGMIGGWLAANGRRQRQAERAVAAIYGGIEREFGLLLVALLVVGGALAAWAVRQNRSAFARIEGLAGQLARRSRELEALNARLLNLQEELLQSVARDLHDEFGQMLTAAAAMLARAERRCGEPAAAEVQAARQVVREAQGQLRNLAAALRPPALDEFGLEPALAAYAAEFSRRAGLALEWRPQTPLPPLPPGRAIHLYRIVQEAVNNATRHGQAKRIQLRLRAREGGLRLEIEDDGSGFDFAATSTGAGLPGIRQRAAWLGGGASIGPRADGLRGTLVQVTVPLAATAGPPVAGAAART
ncbi:MAG: sensor histidine kinase [Terriglobales bacterium]